MGSRNLLGTRRRNVAELTKHFENDDSIVNELDKGVQRGSVNAERNEDG